MLRLVVILLLSFFSTANATVWYVHPDSTLNSIQAGLYSCSTNDTVLVAPSTYCENLTWPFTQSINLVSEIGADMTIIDGGGTGIVILIGTGIDSTTIIKGFTIQNGHSAYGAGIYCGGLECSPTIIGNIITMNTADSVGGGITCIGASPSIDSCTISNNNGDGIYCQISYVGHPRPIIHYNNITDNTGYGVYNKVWNMIFIDARYNWWGDPSGPGGFGPGTGDEVNYFVIYNPWLTEPMSGVEEDIYNQKIRGRGLTFWHYHLTLYELVILLIYMEENLKFTKR